MGKKKNKTLCRHITKLAGVTGRFKKKYCTPQFFDEKKLT